MIEYLEQTLRQKITIQKYDAEMKLPLMYKKNYDIYLAQIGNVEFLLAKPLQDTNLSAIRKQQRQMEMGIGLRCALYLEKMSYYAKEKLLDEGVPFVHEGKQVYLPFLGILLQEQKERNLKPCGQISFLTQKLLLTALYENWQKMNGTEVAKALGVTKTSITRCFDEIEVLEIPYLQSKSRMRQLTMYGTKREQWETILPFLRSPLICEYQLERDVETTDIKSGMSALAEYTMLEDNIYPTYGITKKELGQFWADKPLVVTYGEVPKCVIQELGYVIPHKRSDVIDPLTTFLLVSEKEKEDPRVEKALDEMLEEYVWSED